MNAGAVRSMGARWRWVWLLRRRPMTRGIVAASLTATLAGCLAVPPGQEPQYDVCRRQIHAYMLDTFGQHVTGIDFTYVYERRDLRRWDYSKAVVSVSECPGFHFFEVRATADMCETQPHYGRQPRYLRYLGGFDGC